MKVRFNGMFSTQKKKGCSCHGTRIGESVFLTHKAFILPSGLRKTFSVGQTYEVNDVDGNFLLSYSHIDKNGLRQSSFTRVD